MENIICILDGAVLFVGNVPDLPFHSTLTKAAVVGLENEIQTRVEGQMNWVKDPSFIFDGSLSHQSEYRGAVGIMLADPGSQLGAIFSREAGKAQLCRSPVLARQLVKCCSRIAGTSSTENYREILSESFPVSQISKSINDDRLARILDRLVRSPQASFSATDLSKSVGMSSSWLQHEFTNTVGLPLRAFRKWFRMKSAIISLRQGASIAEAALAGGFYDQAHFSNTFKGIFGLSPTLVFGSGPIRWYVEHSNIIR